jgi:hypothetical protein
MSTEAVGAIWIGGAALNGALIWTTVGLSRLFGHADEDPAAEPADLERDGQDAAAT